MKAITNGRVATWTIIIVMVLLTFVFLWLIRGILFLLFLGILLTAGIEPLVRWLRRGPFNRSTGVLVIYVLIFGVLGLLLYLIIPPLISESQNLVSTFATPESARQAINKIDNDFIKNLANQIYDGSFEFIKNFKISTEAISVGLGVVEVIFSGLTVFVIGFYWSTERTTFKRFVVSLVPDANRSDVRAIWQAVEEKLGAWVRGQLFVMLVTGIMSGIGYSLMGLHFAFPLAVFAALTELIPLVGPYIGGAPAVLVGFTQSLTLGIIVIVYIAVFQVVEGNVLVPRIMKSAVGISPLTVIVSILIGSTLAGIGGALLAVPVGATIQVIITQIFLKKADDDADNNAKGDSPETAQLPPSEVVTV